MVHPLHDNICLHLITINITHWLTGGLSVCVVVVVVVIVVSNAHWLVVHYDAGMAGVMWWYNAGCTAVGPAGELTQIYPLTDTGILTHTHMKTHTHTHTHTHTQYSQYTHTHTQNTHAYNTHHGG